MTKYTPIKKELTKYTNFDNIEDIDNILLHINNSNNRYATLKHAVKQLKEKKNIMKEEILKKYKKKTIKYKNFNNINKIRQILKNIDKGHNDYKLLEPVLKTLEKKQKETAKSNNSRLLKKALFFGNPFPKK